MFREFSIYLFALAVGLGVVGPLLPLQAQEQQTYLRVAVDDVEPFVLLENGHFHGFAIELWELIAKEQELEYHYVHISTTDLMVRAVRNGAADVAIGNIGMTAAREAHIDFTQPMFTSGLQIMTQFSMRENVLSVLLSIFSPTLLTVLGIAFVILNVIAHAIWWLERHSTSDFEANYWVGIQEAFYWAVVTATTVGYGDKVPRRFLGRMVAILWMLLSLFLVSYFTANVTTALTVNELRGAINGPEDLRGREVGTIVGTTAAKYLAQRGLTYRTFANMQSLVAALTTGQIDAVVYDAPVLQYYVSQQTEHSLRLVEPIIQPEFYGIVLAQDSPLREKINIALFQLHEDGRYSRLQQRWFGE